MLDAATAWPAGALAGGNATSSIDPNPGRRGRHALTKPMPAPLTRFDGSSPYSLSLTAPPPRTQHKTHKRWRAGDLARYGLEALSLSNGLVQPASRFALRRIRAP